MVEVMNRVGMKRGKIIIIGEITKNTTTEPVWICRCSMCNAQFEKTEERFCSEGFIQLCDECDKHQTFNKFKDALVPTRKRKQLKSSISIELEVTTTTKTTVNGEVIIESPAVNIEKKRFGSIHVIAPKPTKGQTNQFWQCYCHDCGHRFVESYHRIMDYKKIKGCIHCSEQAGTFVNRKVTDQFHNPEHSRQQAKRYHQRRKAALVGTEYCGFTLLEDTEERKYAETVWKVRTKDGDITYLSKRDMRKLANVRSAKEAEAN